MTELNNATLTEEDLIAEEIMSKCVTRGAAWLDDEVDLWFEQIDTSILDVADSQVCICGQLWCEKALETIIDDGYEYQHETGYEYAVNELIGGEVAAICLGFQAITNYTESQLQYYGNEAVDMSKILESPIYRFPPRQYEYLALSWVAQIEIRKQQRKLMNNE